MATLKTIRKRIGSVRNTQKITKAMKMVAAAKLRRAQTALFQARPYGEHLKSLLARVSAYGGEKSAFYFNGNDSHVASFLIFTSDRGLCGGFNSNLLRRVYSFLTLEARDHQEVEINTIGRKGREFFRARKMGLKKELTGLTDHFRFEQALEMAREIISSYEEGKYGAYYLAYNGFKSAISQEIRIRKILPLSWERSMEEGHRPIIFEPSVSVLFQELLPRYLAAEIYLAHLESNASELGARMSAMENATNNAREMIGLLTLQYNRARQAAITKELMDIVNGAEALK